MVYYYFLYWGTKKPTRYQVRGMYVVVRDLSDVRTIGSLGAKIQYDTETRHPNRSD